MLEVLLKWTHYNALVCKTVGGQKHMKELPSLLSGLKMSQDLDVRRHNLAAVPVVDDGGSPPFSMIFEIVWRSRQGDGVHDVNYVFLPNDSSS